MTGGAAPSGVVVQAQEPAARTSTALGGVWQLNRDLSAPAGGGPGGETGRHWAAVRRRRRPAADRRWRAAWAVLAAVAVAGGGRGGGMGGPGGGGGGGGGAAGHGGGSRTTTRCSACARRCANCCSRRRGSPSCSTRTPISFTDDQGHVRKFVANGKDEKHQLQAATLETKSAWKDGALVIQWETGRGPTVVRSYRVDPELQRLVIETSMKGGRDPGGADRPPIKHVYDAVTDTAQ